MPAQHIKAIDIDRINPTACCCDCGAEVADAPEDEIWIFWNDERFYCSKCAKHENIDGLHKKSLMRESGR